MPRGLKGESGPKGERRPARVIGAALMAGRTAPGVQTSPTSSEWIAEPFNITCNQVRSSMVLAAVTLHSVAF